jgi:hypothetical protein
MVRIKHTACPRVRLEIVPMASAVETKVPSGRREVSPDPSSSRSVDDSGDRKSRFGSFDEVSSDSEESSQMKVAVTPAAAGITYDFGISAMGKARITSLESNACYFLRGYC